VIDAAVIANSCDSAIMVISSNSISAKFAKNVKAQLEKSGCRILGAVLNNVENKDNSYYSKYYYQKYYKSYYGKYEAYGHTPKEGK